ncbi:MAG: ComF family protein [Paludibacteraceae bacterium]|nr:ComF family protein [Paludibacteraceae bacterium]
MNWLRNALDGFTELFYPKLCVGCGEKLFQNEKFICLQCRSSLPLLREHEVPDNFVEQHLYGDPFIESATALMLYEKESVTQRLVHEIKYHGAKELARSFGRMLGRQIREGRFSSVDVIVPIPLHPKRLKWRGYNQSEWFARGLSEEMNVPVCTDWVRRVVETTTQTEKNAEERWNNVQGIFALNPNLPIAEMAGKHILIVDDVITTGATAMACAKVLARIGNVKLSVASIAAVNAH